MKLLFSLTYYSPYISGLTMFVRRLAENMAKKGNEVRVVCFRHDKDLPESETINKVSVTRVNPFIKISKGFLSGDWIFKSRKLVNSSDIVIVNLPQVEGLITAIMAKILSKKLIAIYV
jgi:hypothetical protein